MQTLKKFIKYYKPYKTVFFIDLLCATIISAIDLAFPQLLRTLTKTLFAGAPGKIISALIPITIGLLVAYIIQTACRYYVTYAGHMMGARMERDMRKELFDQYEKLSFSYYDQNNSGQMMSKLVSDLFDISELAHHGPENLFISLIKIIGSFIFLFMINRMLAVPMLILVVLMLVFSYGQNKKMQETFMDNRRKIGDINSSLQDTLAGIRVVQSFANERIEQEKFNRSNENFLISKDANYRCMGSFMSGNAFFQGMMYLVTLVFGGFLIAHGRMEASDLAMYALYIGIFISPIQILVELTEMMQKGLSGFRRFLEVVETEPDIVDAADAKPLKNVKGNVCYEDVSFHYSDDDTPVLSHVSFEIPAGKSIALVGPSGSGKTTICSLLPRFYDVTEGRVTIDGNDVRKLTLESLRSQIGLVSQDVYLFGGSIKDNIAYGKPDATMDEIVDAAKKANIHDFIMELPDKYDTFVGERGTRLSGGQKQRISIARVFLKNPPVLILDEATSALDNESERFIQRSLEELAKDRTTITIAHRLSTIRNADEILVVADCGIAERGTHEELLARDGIYARYYDMSR
ncbi:ABC transporter ATP-binding protein [Agathobacter rectalis]|jgi:ATP-binding cassette subfamily B protein|uniref:ABC transporter ATP-binding protein n=1 Tax=Agathobacter rectalis TaxID=39491 RepID=A0A414HWV6_9FIRM|nr:MULTISPECIES: ABC transporter ATP-binding protein [Agathobacter]RGZ19340.1 ABC transporter ATP-binding protein [Agathobacter rectalis]RGZ74696.1 ABC transporter ATP-binding protein [Agathobacter rectalis]RHD92891.1 ABC transporter ATP-binding protein [Agathobacter rectalis]RHG23356.1 ABC transporter ATP-binding protein [Agathobacter rectalis]